MKAITKQDIAKQTRILDICGCLISAIAILTSMIIYRAIPMPYLSKSLLKIVQNNMEQKGSPNKLLSLGSPVSTKLQQATVLIFRRNLKVFIQIDVQRALQHQRTTIHLFLFGAMLTNVIVQLLLYTDQVIVNGFDESLFGGMEVYRGINNTQYVCEVFYFVQEYSMSTIFMWILIDAVFISRCFSCNTVRFTFPLIRYAALSCLLPLLNVAIWAALTGYFFETETKVDCWFGYNFNKLYWILQGPRLFINALLLAYIMKILIPKLKRTRKADMGKLKLAVKTTICLLVLLVLTSACSMIETDTWTIDAWVFALWSYTAHFFRSFQGLITIVLYCCLNHEVQETVRRWLNLFPRQRSPENNAGNRTQDIEQQATVSMIHNPLCSDTNERRQSTVSSRRMLRRFHEIYDQRDTLGPEIIEMNVYRDEPGPSRISQERDRPNPSSSEEFDSDSDSDSDASSNRYRRKKVSFSDEQDPDQE
ncbi:PDF receptor-like [Maniola jurtina]|uniref:PDF receptor-like n=1 Tax=Maniola jurtina TaxID=191418 RepID=UPI001E685D52|nr:PDF receptor-like [Maniola jurtina]